ncbi:MAG: hydrogen peroxide-dependent heme synthase [Verrucomicrobiota bacterium]
MSESSLSLEPIVPHQGWHVLHLFYRVDQSLWASLPEAAQAAGREALIDLIDSIRDEESAQVLAFSMLTPKSDLGFMILTDDLHRANRYEKQLERALGPDVLVPTYSYLSMTELSEYTTTEERYGESLVSEEGLEKDSAEYLQKIEEFKRRMAKYNSDRLHPNMPDWPVFCFYPMSKRRGETHNWYHLDFEKRRELMMGHARVGRGYAGRVRQLITGSTGLDEMEWGVTLFSNNTQDIKEIVYEMRFDEVSALYAEFGDFYIGLQIPLVEILKRIGLA